MGTPQHRAGMVKAVLRELWVVPRVWSHGLEHAVKGGRPGGPVGVLREPISGGGGWEAGVQGGPSAMKCRSELGVNQDQLIKHSHWHLAHLSLSPGSAIRKWVNLGSCVLI